MITPFHAVYFANELTRRGGEGLDRLSQSLFDALVDLNPRYRINPSNREFDIIYINGDNNVENLRKEDETWKVRMIEPEFKKLMFEEA